MAVQRKKDEEPKPKNQAPKNPNSDSAGENSKEKDGSEDRGDDPPQTVTMTVEELDKILKARDESLIAKMREEMSRTAPKGSSSASEMKEFAEQIADAMTVPGTRNLLRPVREEDLDPEDMMDTPVSFFAYTSSTFIMDDRRQNRYISTPYNRPIVFERSLRYLKPETKSTRFDKQYISICEAKVWSKKEVEWLRKHSQYGITFFEQAVASKTVDGALAEALAKFSGICNNMSQHEVIREAASRGIKNDPDVTLMKQQLIHAMAGEELRRSKQPVAEVFSMDQGKDATVEDILRAQPQE